MAPDKVDAVAGEAFRKEQYGADWYIYSREGRRLSGPLSEDRAERTIRGFLGR